MWYCAFIEPCTQLHTQLYRVVHTQWYKRESRPRPHIKYQSLWPVPPMPNCTPYIPILIPIPNVQMPQHKLIFPVSQGSDFQTNCGQTMRLCTDLVKKGVGTKYIRNAKKMRILSRGGYLVRSNWYNRRYCIGVLQCELAQVNIATLLCSVLHR